MAIEACAAPLADPEEAKTSAMLARMLAALGERLGRLFRATAPDPFVIAILLTLLTGALAATFGRHPISGNPLTVAGAVALWQGGFWGLLPFGMQMCLILVTGHALASSKPVSRLILGVARRVRGPRQAVVLTSVIAMLCALVNWGFGLIVGAILAREVGAQLRARGVEMPRGLLAAAGYTGLLVWHGGLSGSAPLKAASKDGQTEVLGAAMGAEVGPIIVDHTIFSTLNLVVTGGLLVIVPLLLVLMCPRRGARIGDVSSYAPKPAEDKPSAPAPLQSPDEGRIPAMLERTPVVVWIIALPALCWIAYRFASVGTAALDLNTAIMIIFALGMAMHGSAQSYASSVEDGVRGCAGIIIQFPLYAGIMGMISGSGLGAMVSNLFVNLSRGSESGLSLAMFGSAGIVNLFVPSGGGQWAIQGPIGIRAALDAGMDPARIVMAVAYGDQLTNMLQPFWALPLLAITGARAQEVVGYTAILMVAAGMWMGVWLAVM